MAQNNAEQAYTLHAQRRIAALPEQNIEERKKPGRKPVSEARKKVRAFIAVVLVFGACAGLVARYAQMTQMNEEVNTLKTQLAEEQRKLGSLKLDLTLATDLDKISQVALNELGMDYPKDDQIIYIDLDQDGKNIAMAGEAADKGD
ncbi:MAG: hypothetical protein Q8O09_02530 [Bacillota bacterium]|nr:hypothetical protein [Bacillota bacterium]